MGKGTFPQALTDSQIPKDDRNVYTHICTPIVKVNKLELICSLRFRVISKYVVSRKKAIEM